jgi:3-deoxy-manno-octulosonate cytidylyltransferase (CMP-KDO synthetase)
MIQWVYERAKMARLLADVIVATDDRRIEKTVKGFGGKVVMTSIRHNSGTDRVAEAVRKARAAIVVNIQGDEPLIEPKAIDRAIKALLEDKESDLSTLAAPAFPKDLFDPDVVKVVCDQRGRALYFSRAAIPYPRERARGGALQHIGLYAYRGAALQKLSRLAMSRLEKVEKLEQLRALENGMKIKVVRILNGWPSVDRPEDIQKVELLIGRTLHA